MSINGDGMGNPGNDDATLTLNGTTLMKVQTTRFGELEVADDQIYHFPEGLLGFGNVRRYFIQPHGKGPFQWLQAVEPGSLAFVICDPRVFKPDYRVKISPEDMESLRLASLDAAVVLVIMVVPRDPRQMTANLQGPLVLNPHAKLARQLVLLGDEYTTKYRVFPDAAAAPGSRGGN